MENIFREIDQLLHNTGVSKSDRYGLLKDIFTVYSKCASFDKIHYSEKWHPLLRVLSKMDMDNKETIQKFFMMFGEKIMKKSLDQFYTPLAICTFVASMVPKIPGLRALEPASGTGDMIMHIQADEHHFWDISPSVSEATDLNCKLHAVAGSIQTVNSLNFETEDRFEVIATNPPFGTKTVETDKTILSKYQLWNGKSHAQLGILFIEKSLKLLKPGGVLFIVLPSGYLTNQSESYVREYLLTNYRVLGVFGLPTNTFKRSGTGVDTSLLVVQNSQTEDDYEIFVEEITSIGIDTSKKDAPPLFKKDPRTGKPLVVAGAPLVDNHFADITPSFQYFCFKNKVTGLVHNETPRSYTSMKKSDVVKAGYDMNVKWLLPTVQRVVERVCAGPHFTIGAHATISRKKKSKRDDAKYIYLDISEIGKGCYKGAPCMGWELPNRATYEVVPGDILVSKLKGNPSFCIVGANAQDLIVTNGVFVVRIPDERHKWSLFKYLFTEDFKTQFNAHASGSIMASIKDTDFLEKIYIPLLDDNETEWVRTKVGHLMSAHLLWLPQVS